MGRLTGTTTAYAFLTGRNFAASYGYDAASNRTGFTDPEGGATAFVYDTLNRLQTLTPPAALDRKSTRLNSSHVRISYAVFCLKKKQIVTLDPRVALMERR